MNPSIFETAQVLPRPRERIFDFFSEARNLELITPPFLRFRVLTPEPIEMAVETTIDYRLRLRGVPFRWRSEITVWEPPTRFVDEQRRGPYRRWVHTHTFVEQEGATRIEDRVEYGVPGGRFVDRWFVRPEVERIFAYRRKRIEELLG